MLEGIWKQLKSGTDVRGVALPGVAGQDVDLTEARVRAIASAFVAFQTERSGKKAGEMTVAVGRDSRLSGPAIAGWVIEELKNAGCRVLDCGMASTPAMFMTTVYRKTDAAVMITAGVDAIPPGVWKARRSAPYWKKPRTGRGRPPRRAAPWRRSTLWRLTPRACGR